jgi:hypothetical protein
MSNGAASAAAAPDTGYGSPRGFDTAIVILILTAVVASGTGLTLAGHSKRQSRTS